MSSSAAATFFASNFRPFIDRSGYIGALLPYCLDTLKPFCLRSKSDASGSVDRERPHWRMLGQFVTRYIRVSRSSVSPTGQRQPALQDDIRFFTGSP